MSPLLLFRPLPLLGLGEGGGGRDRPESERGVAWPARGVPAPPPGNPERGVPAARGVTLGPGVVNGVMNGVSTI